MEELNKVWNDQISFNRNFFPPAESFEERSKQSKELVLCMMSELGELLNAVKWKLHRNTEVKPNREQIKNELTDLLKYLLSLYIVWNVTPEEAIKDYWRKSMVVRQRFSEEFITNLEGQIVLCDIDGILADYYTGFLQWMIKHRPFLQELAKEFMGRNIWLDARSLGIDEQVWQELKHDFRTSRGKLEIPPYPQAKEFLEKCFLKGYKVVLLTSRPIDKYPNIYTDTLEWLNRYDLPFHNIWWAIDKGEMVLSKSIREQIVFAIDDDPKYVEIFRKLKIPTYWVHPKGDYKSLQDLIDYLTKGGAL